MILIAAAGPIYFTLSTTERLGAQSNDARPAAISPAVDPSSQTPATRSAVAVTFPRPSGTIDVSDWLAFKARFIEPDGKLVDNFSRLSHSEGQGYAMLLALAAGDRLTFDRVWDWTRTNLKRDDDALLAWKWQPGETGGGAVADNNDATDADILVAWALHRAAKQWQEPAYDRAATPIAAAILEKLVRDFGGYAVLLPGHTGFEDGGGLTVNLSYWIFPAFHSLNEIAPSPRWFQLEQSGLSLLKQARFGQNKLPSDWIVLRVPPTGGIALSPATDKPVYGFDAVRIPLYLMWNGMADAETMAPFLAFWRSTPQDKIPATVNVATGDSAAYAVTPGMRAIVTAVLSRAEAPSCQAGICFTPALPPIDQDHDYYSAALGLLVRLALSEAS